MRPAHTFEQNLQNRIEVQGLAFVHFVHREKARNAF